MAFFFRLAITALVVVCMMRKCLGMSSNYMLYSQPYRPFNSTNLTISVSQMLRMPRASLLTSLRT